MDKHAIAQILAEIALLLDLKGDNPFKIRAYQSGARALETLEGDLETLIAEDRLREVPGIGAALVEKVTTLAQTGHLEFYERLRASVPEGLLAMLEIPGLGPKKIKALNEQLGICTIAELTEACQAGKVAQLKGFGAKTQENILRGIVNREAYSRRHLWWDAWLTAEPILAGLRALPEVLRAEHAGSLRRCLETVGDLDFIVAASHAGPVMHWFTSAIPGIVEVTAKGETKSSIRLADGLQADLRVVPPGQFAFALHHFTGSKDHNVKLRHRALQRGLSLSEWGLTPKDSEGAPSLPAETEADIFRHLGLPYIPPELREGLDEFEIAETEGLPVLLEEADLRGAFHNHTTASDGRNSLEEMVAQAEALGWEYLGIADHSKASVQANGLDAGRLARQIEAIAALNASGRFRVRVLAGVECDILPDGRLDLDDAILGRLDYVVASVHSSFNLSEEAQTARILRAMQNPRVTMLGHPTGRRLLRREPYPVNIPKLVDAALELGVVIELNANPSRLDMDWRHWKGASRRGLKCAINPDAHDAPSLALVKAGVQAARKGWLRKEDVLNTLPLGEVLAFIRSARAR